MTSLKMAAGCDVCSTPNTKEMWRFSKQTDTKRRRLKDIPRSFHPSLSLLLLFFFLQNVSCQTNTNILNPQITSSSIVLPELQASSLVCKLDTTISPTSSDFPLTWGRSGGLPTAATVQTSQRDVGGGVTSYETRIRFTPTALDNQLRFSCNAQVGVFTGVAYYSPQIILRPDTPVITGPDVVNAFDVRTWTCVSTGSSYIAPNVYWRNGRGRSLTDGVDKVTVVGVEERDNTVFTITNTITFGIPAEMGNYTLQCIVIHEYAGYTASVTSRKFVTVYFLPQITKSDADILYTTQSIRQTISCIITASSPAAQSVSWTKDGAPIDFSGNRYEPVSVSSPSLIIKEVTDKDEGNYTCSVTNSNGTSSWPTPTRLIVRYSPIIIYTGVTNFVGSIGGSLTIPCPVDAVPAATTIRWWKYVPGGRQAIRPTSDPRYSGGTAQAYGLTINPIQAGDATTYFCEADNDVGTGTGSNVTVTVNSLAQVEESTNYYERDEGESVSMACSLSLTHPATHIDWIKDGREYLQGNYSVSRPALNLELLDREDDAVYFCVITTADNISLWSEPVNLIINHAPRFFLLNQTTYSKKTGDNLTLLCPLVANPKAKRTWLRNNIILNTTLSSKYVLSDDEEKMTILDLKLEDEGGYTCKASNRLGSATGETVTLNIDSRPGISTPDSQIVAVENNQVTITCNVTPLNSLTGLYWLKDGQRLDTSDFTRYGGGTTSNPSLTIYTVRDIDTGSYACVATNQYGSTTSGSVDLSLNYPPRVTVASAPISSGQSTTIVLTCSANASPQVDNLYWRKENLGTINPQSNPSKYSGGTKESPTLLIFRAENSDSGVYYCVATNSLGTTTSDAVSVSVTSVPQVSVSFNNVTLSEGTSQYILPCTINASPAVTSVYWQKGGSVLDTTNQPSKYSGSTTNNPSLTIRNIEKGDAGSYVCVAMNSVGTGTSQSVEVTINYRPALTVTSTPISSSIGGTIILTCNVDANPSITNLYWTKSGQGTLSSSSSPNKYSGGTVASPTLLIFNAQSSDGGQYSCVAVNSVGTGTSNAVSVTVTNVPEVTVGSTSSTIREGTSQFTVTCIISASPQVTSSYWEKDGVRLDVSGINNKYTVGTLTNPTLTIRNVDRSDAGSYVCVGQNSIGIGKSPTVVLTVTYQPSIVVNNNDVSAQAGQSRTLTCSVSATPALTDFYWTRNGVRIQPSQNPSKYFGGTAAQTDLTIFNLNSVTDSGSYSCVAVNSLGRTTSPSVQLNVVSTPVISPPDNPNVVANENQPVTMPCQVSSADTLTDLYWVRNGQRLDTSDSAKYSGGTPATPSLTILRLSYSDSGSYYCVATNNFGTAAGENSTVDVRHQPKLTVANRPILVNPGTTAILTCTVIASPALTDFYWTGPQGQISSSSTPAKYSGGNIASTALVIFNIDQSDAGDYRCVGTNSLGRTTSSPVEVDLTLNPIITPPADTDVGVDENQQVTLPCQVTSVDPILELYWVKDGQRLDTSNSAKYRGGTASTPSLTILSTETADSGNYLCRARNLNGETSGDGINVGIKDEPQVTVPNRPVKANPGFTITLTCDINANPAITDFYWTKSGQGRISSSSNPSKYSGGTVSNPTLQIFNVQTSDAGDYSCVATNPLGTVTSDPVSVTLTNEPVVVPPGNPDVDVDANKSVTLPCVVTPVESLTQLYWAKNGQRLDISNNTKYTGGLLSSPDLKINFFTPADRGHYVCVATNSFGTTSGDGINVDIKYKPILTVPSTLIIVNPGSTITLVCNVDANPDIYEFYWTSSTQGQISSSSNPSKYSGGTVSSPTLQVLNAENADAGEYECFAGNTIGATVSESVQVVLTNKPVIVPPQDKNITVDENDQVTLPCLVTSFVSLTDLYWLKDGQRLTTSNITKYRGGTVSTPSLTVLSFSQSDRGGYKCVAANDYGTTEGEEINIDSEYPPRLTVSSTPVRGSQGSNITLTCDIKAKPAITEFYWTKERQGIIRSSTLPSKFSGGTISNPTIQILNAQISDTGNYACVARNPRGQVTSDPVSVIVTNEPVIAPPVETEIDAVENQPVTLPCQVTPLNSLTDLYWTKDNQRIDTSDSTKYTGGTVSTPSLTILSTDETDTGNYFCMATNGFGTTPGEEISVTTTYKPKLSVSRKEIRANPGSIIILTCDINANPAITEFYWYKSGIGRVNPSFNPNKYSGGTLSSPTLVISNAQNSDAGDYSCVARNPVGASTSDDVNVVITNEPVITPPDETEIDVDKNQPVTLACQVTPLNSLTDLYWTKDGQRLDTSNSAKYRGGTVSTPSLTILSIDETDTGNYVCVATNGFGTTPGDEITVETKYEPKLTVPSTPVRANPGSTITLTCDINANPAITDFYWTKSGQGRISSSSNPSKYSGGTVSNPTLQIFNVQNSDAGDYSCVATNPLGTVTSDPVSVTLTNEPVITPPDETEIDVDKNQPVTLPCQVTPLNSLTDLYWTKDNQRLDTSNSAKYRGGTVSTPSLTILSIDETDIGNYFCMATNGFGTTPGKEITVKTTSEPKLTVPSTPVRANPGSTITLTCDINANPAITDFYWTKSGQGRISSSSNPSKYSGGTVSNPTLQIFNVQTSDAGDYSCVATNSLGTVTSDPVSVDITNEPVITPPDETEIDVDKNQPVTLACQVTPLNSLTDLYWTKDGQRLDTSNNVKYSGGTVSTPSLTILSIDDTDSGNYVCVATNGFGTTPGDEITVETKSEPKLIVPSTPVRANPGSTITLTCDINANPAITDFYWTKSGQGRISSSSNPSKYSGGTVSNPTLQILNAQNSDAGDYSCVATNSLGTVTSDPVSVIVTRLPVITPPDETEIDVDKNQPVTLPCQVTPLTSLTDLYWTKDGQRLDTSNSAKYSGGTVSTPSLTILSVDESGSGNYVCVATNGFGTTPGDEITVATKSEPKLTVSSIPVRANPGSTITLTCDINANPAITDFYWTKSGQGRISSSSNPSKYSGGTVSNPTLQIFNAENSDAGDYSCVATNLLGTVTSDPVSVVVTNEPVVVPPVETEIDVEENQQVTLPCQVTPLVSLTDLYWTKDGQRIDTSNSVKYSGGTVSTPSLTVRSLNDADSGEYVCVATNGFGTTPGEEIKVDITHAPRLTVPSTPVRANPGSTITLTCDINANPAITDFYWTKSGQGRISSSSNPSKYSGGTVSNPTLQIFNVQTSDAGDYSCVATNPLGTVTSDPVSVTLTNEPVITPPDETEIDVDENQPVTLACQVTPLNSLTDLYWTKDGQRLDTSNGVKYSGGTVSTPSLTILSIDETDSGNYACVATNGFGTTPGEEITINTAYPPRLDVSTTPIRSAPGSTITLTCGVKSNPTLTSFYWTKNGQGQVSSASNPSKYVGGTIDNPTLQILNAESSDAGSYSCVARNSLGTSISNPVSVIVTDEPIITPPADTEIDTAENERVTLPCQVTPLNSLTSLYWTKDGVRLNTANSAKYSGGTVSTPSLTLVSTDDTDSGGYVCVATNNFGVTRGDEITVDVSYEPRVTVPNSPLSTSPGLTVTLTCSVDANPAITGLYWTQSGQGPIQSTSNPSKYSGGTVSNPTLQIFNAQTSDASDYSCVATNPLGTVTSDPVSVVVTNEPVITPPDETEIDAVENQPVTIACQVTPLNSLTDLYWTKDGQRLDTSNSVKYSGGTVSTPSLTILSIDETDSGNYACVATNGFGTTPGDDIAINTAYPPKVTVPSKPVGGKAGSTITLTCDIRANPALTDLYWTKVGQVRISSASNPTKYSGGTLTNPTLQIFNASSSDSGDYSCVGINSLGTTTSDSVPVKIATEPVITPPDDTDIDAVENQQVTLPCQVTPLDSLTDLYWTKDGVRLNTANNPKYYGGTVSTPSLTILSLTDTDSGNYVCVAANDLGTTPGEDINVDITYKPKLVVPNTPVTGRPGSTITLTCDVNTNPAVSDFYWTKAGQGRISSLFDSAKYSGGTISNPTLQILNAESSDTGDYFCVAINSLGTTNSDSVPVIAANVPAVSLNTPSPIREGTSQYTLTCTVSGAPPATSVYWQKDGSVLNVASQPSKYSGGTLDNPSLTIRNVAREDAGTYSCHAVNSDGTGSSPSVTLDVTYQPSVSVSGDDVKAKTGGSTTLTCSVSASPALSDFYWTKNGVRVQLSVPPKKYSGGTMALPDLTIYSLDGSTDSGSYRCVAVNSLGTTTSPTVQLDVSSAPSIDPPTTTDIEAEENQDVTLPCQVTPLDSVTELYWLKDGKRLNTAGSAKYRGGTVTTPSLTISSLTDTDSGEYVCVATNDFGTTPGEDITVDITYRPRVVVPNTQVTGSVGGIIEVACDISTNPPLTSFYWTKSGQGAINPSSNPSKYSGGTVNNPTLRISNIADSDAGDYSCVATNSKGTTTSDAVSVSVTNVPSVTVLTTTVELEEGTSQYNIICDVSGSPAATSVYWLKDGSRLNIGTQSSKYSGGTLSNPSLSIRTIERSDAGSYQCVAENSFGAGTSLVVKLQVTYEPTLTVGKQNQRVKTGTTTTLTCSVSAYPALTDFYWTKSGVRIQPSLFPSKYSGGTISQTDLTIFNLQPATDSGSYYCVAVNSRGSQTSSTVQVVVFSEPVIAPPEDTDITVEEKQPVTLPCQVTPLGSLTALYWTKDGQRLDTTDSTKYSGGTVSTPSLTILTLSEGDTGGYVCVATNDFGTDSGPDITLDVTYRPRLTVPITTVTNSPSSTISLTCDVSTNPTLTNLYWTKTGQGPISSTANPSKYSGGTVNSPTLLILNAENSDAGDYSCVATNSVGTTTSDAVTVAVTNVPLVSVGATSATVNEGTNQYTLDCDVSGSPTPTSLYWQKDGSRLNTGTQSSKYSGGTLSTPGLTIRDVVRADAGSYVCVAENSIGAGSSPAVSLQVSYRPVVNVSNSDVSGTAGTSVTLTCSVSAFPAPTSVYWTRNGARLQVSQNPSKYSGGSLAQPNLTVHNLNSGSDPGSYACVAENSMGSTTSPSVTLVIGSRPVITTPSTSVNAAENQQATLTCQVTPLNSLTDLYWTKDGQRLDTSNTTKYSGGTSSSPSLTILSVAYTDSGSYACVATNNQGTTTGGNIALGVTYKPRLTVETSPISTTPGSAVSLTCTVNANPATTEFYWSKVGSGRINSASDASKYSGGTLNNPTLTLLSTEMSDSGDYTCTARNSQGTTTSTTVRVNIITAPQITVTPSSVTVEEGEPVVTLTCSVVASPPVDSSFWTKDDSSIDPSSSPRFDVLSVSQPTLRIFNIERGDAGSYVCLASNSEGLRSSTSIPVAVTYPPTLTTPRTDVVGAKDSSVTLSCVVDAFPTITSLFWLKDGTRIDYTQNPGKYSGGTVAVPNLTILNLDETVDPGTYRCDAENSRGSSQGASINLSVTFDPVITVPDSVSGAEGQNLVIPCDPQMFPTPTGISWYKNNALINVQGNPTKYTGGTLSTPSLTILNPTGSDSGTYRCSATNGQDTVNGDITVTVTYKPKVTITSSEITTNENQNVVIQVAVDSSPAADSVVWKRADIDNPVTQTDVTKGGRISGGTVASPSLTINNVGFGDVANYYVTVTNSEGSTTVGPVPLRVRYQPTNVVARAIPSTLLAGERLVLSCSADAYPSPTFAWFQGGQQRASTANYTKIQTSSSDFAEFTCSVTNELGTSSATVTPNVRFAPFAPVAVINKFGTLPSSLDLECEIRANPLPTTYTWFKGNSSLSFTTRTITILLTSVDDLGTYSCTASNSLGSLNPPLQINVQQGTEETTPAAGASTNNEDDGLSTATIILIVVIVIIVLIIIILLLIFCCIQGVFAKCCGKSKESAKVAPTQQKRNDLNGVPPPFPFPAEQMNGDIEKPERIEITPRTPLAPIPAGAIISVPEKAGPRAHYLPPLTSGTENVDNYYREEKRRSRKKKKHRRHRKDDQNALTGMEEDGAESSPTPRTQREEDVGTSNVYEEV